MTYLNKKHPSWSLYTASNSLYFIYTYREYWHAVVKGIKFGVQRLRKKIQAYSDSVNAAVCIAMNKNHLKLWNWKHTKNFLTYGLIYERIYNFMNIKISLSRMRFCIRFTTRHVFWTLLRRKRDYITQTRNCFACLIKNVKHRICNITNRELSVVYVLPCVILTLVTVHPRHITLHQGWCMVMYPRHRRTMNESLV